MLKVSTLIPDISVNVLHQLNRFTPTPGVLFAIRHTTLPTTQTFLGLGEVTRVSHDFACCSCGERLQSNSNADLLRVLWQRLCRDCA